MTNDAAFEFTESMNEVSGYGGDYESCCRAAVCAGGRWFAEHLDSDPIFVGELPHNADAEALLGAMTSAWFTLEDGQRWQVGDFMTPLMFCGLMQHVLFIAKRGWRTYVLKMSAPVRIVTEEDEA